MTKNARKGLRTSRTGRMGTAVLSAALLLSTAGCESLLDVVNPGRVDVGDLNDPRLAETLFNSALGRFECAFTSHVASTAALSEELIDSSNWANLNGWGQRGVQLLQAPGSCPDSRAASALGSYTPLQQARYLADDAVRLITDFPAAEVPKRDEYFGYLKAYSAYATLLLGEGFCEMAIDQGPRMSRSDVFQRAEGIFGEALDFAQILADEELRNFALVGRARSRLNLGDLAGAAQDAAQVSTGFVRYSEYSTNDPIRENRIVNMNRENRFLSAVPGTYGDLELDGVPDPRVRIQDSGQRGHDNQTAHWYQLKYDNPGSEIVLASWMEAQLIIAEADPTQTEAAINRIRAAQDLPAFTLEPGEDRIEAVLEERRRQLWLEGHRLNDMIRHDIDFPMGNNHKGQAYGPVTCMPLPDAETRNNPNFRN